jgi:pilus assembly protein CpaF
MSPLKQAIEARLHEDPLVRHSPGLSREDLAEAVGRAVEALQALGTLVAPEEAAAALASIQQDALIYGPLYGLMHDRGVTDVMVNGPEDIFVERGGRRSRARAHFRDEEHLRATVHRLLALSPSKRLDESTPFVDLSLDDGSRVNVVIPPIAVGGAKITVRRYSRWFRGIDDFVANGTLDARMATLLAAAVRAKVSVLFSGATGTGKTTLLEVLGAFIPEEERLVVIEDTLELHFHQPNVVRMLTRAPNIEGAGEITIGRLFFNALRMRPDRIILGEIRGREALDYLQAVNSGHRGSFAVIHAGSPEEALLRLENLVPVSGLPIPASVTRSQISHGVELVVQVEQLQDGRRVLSRLSEVGEVGPDGEVQVHDLFRFERLGLGEGGKVVGEFVATGRVPRFLQQLVLAGTGVDRSLFAPG